VKLLWFSHFIPFPPVGGASQRSFNLLRQAAKSHEVSLVAFNLLGHPETRLEEWRHELGKYCVSIDFWEMPIRWKGAGWWARLAASSLDRVPYSCRSFSSSGLQARWRRTLERSKGAVAHFDSIDLALFAGGAPSFRKVLNHHNCESAMAHRRAQQEPSLLKRVYLLSQARRLARLEQRVCSLFDVNTAVSQLDAEALQGGSPQAHFHVVENGTDTSYFQPDAAPSEPDTIIFAGSLSWYANVSAVEYFVREIWPLVRTLNPVVRFLVAGQGAPGSLARRLSQDPRMALIADPQDIRPWIARASVFVCPILDGGGTKLKILDAMAMGKAIVATSMSCEGLEVKHDEHILIANTPQDFASMIALVLENRTLGQRLGAAARILVENRYSWDIVGQHLNHAYQCARDRSTCHGLLRRGMRVAPGGGAVLACQDTEV